MKIVPLAEVKSRLSAYVELCQTEPVIITKNGRAAAMLVPCNNDEDNLLSLLIANNPRFRQVLEESEKRLRQTGGISHEEFWKRVDAIYEKPLAKRKSSSNRSTKRVSKARRETG